MLESLISLPAADPSRDNAYPSREIPLHPYTTLFEQWYPDIFDLFYKVGIHPFRQSIMQSLYLSRSVSPHRPNIGLHSVAVALCARAIATLLGPHPIIPGVDIEDITKRALLHDIGKPFELMRRDMRREVGAVYSENAYCEVYKLLVDAGVDESEAVTVVTAGVDAGHLSVRRFLYVDSAGTVRLVAGNVPGKILHLADSMVFTSVPNAEAPSVTHLCLPRNRILGSTSRQRYPWLWERGLGLDGDREIVEIQDIRSTAPGISLVGSYAAVLAWTSNAICNEFAQKIDIFNQPSANQPDTDAEGVLLSAVLTKLSEPLDLPLAS